MGIIKDIKNNQRHEVEVDSWFEVLHFPGKEPILQGFYSPILTFRTYPQEVSRPPVARCLLNAYSGLLAGTH